MKKTILTLLLVMLTTSAHASVIYIDFENITSYPHNSDVTIDSYYNGGVSSDGSMGPNLGVNFGSGSLLLCLNTFGISCTNASRGGFGIASSQRNALGLIASEIVNVAAGFDTGFSFVYSNPANSGIALSLYDGVDARGNLLARAVLPATVVGRCDPRISLGAEFCPFFQFSLVFNGIARSVFFDGSNVAFDDLTFGSTRIGGIPEPASWAMMIAGFGLVGAAKRRRRVHTDVITI